MGGRGVRANFGGLRGGQSWVRALARMEDGSWLHSRSETATRTGAWRVQAAAQSWVIHP